MEKIKEHKQYYGEIKSKYEQYKKTKKNILIIILALIAIFPVYVILLAIIKSNWVIISFLIISAILLIIFLKEMNKIEDTKITSKENLFFNLYQISDNISDYLKQLDKKYLKEAQKYNENLIQLMSDQTMSFRNLLINRGFKTDQEIKKFTELIINYSEDLYHTINKAESSILETKNKEIKEITKYLVNEQIIQGISYLTKKTSKKQKENINIKAIVKKILNHQITRWVISIIIIITTLIILILVAKHFEIINEWKMSIQEYLLLIFSIGAAIAGFKIRIVDKAIGEIELKTNKEK